MGELKDLLKRLSNAHGISGYEGNIREIIEEEMKPYVDEIRTDRVGNLIGTKEGKKPSVMIAAHMDEIGLMAKYVDDNGFIRFVTVGGWFDQTLLSQRVNISGKNGPISGVIGSKPPHRMDAEERKKPIKADDMFIDIGAKSKEDAEEMGIVPGSTISIDMELKELGNNKVTGKAFDNRAGVVMMLEALKRMNTDLTVYAVGTVQEEVGLKGARTSAFGLDPDVAIATDVTIPGDHPGIEKKDASIEMGKGPSVNVLDASGRGLITPEPVLKWLCETAEKHEIPIQLDVSAGGTTDATAIFVTRSGIPSGGISIPCRYIHSPVEVLNLDDLDKCAELIARAVESAGDYF
ncbi:MAG: M42 family metallopeptidase [Halobacteriota archaeon]|nr:M42 family metallopeptidase [Halobacteriota archaeon]